MRLAQDMKVHVHHLQDRPGCVLADTPSCVLADCCFKSFVMLDHTSQPTMLLTLIPAMDVADTAVPGATGSCTCAGSKVFTMVPQCGNQSQFITITSTCPHRYAFFCACTLESTVLVCVDP